MSEGRELVDRFAIEEILLGYLLPPELVTAITDDVDAAFAARSAANAELLAACEAALDRLYASDDDLFQQLRAAIAKARGQS